MRQNYIRNVDIKDRVPQKNMLQMIVQEIESDKYLRCSIQMLLVRPP